MSYSCSNFSKNPLAEEDLCQRAQQGDRTAEEILAEHCSELVKSCARPYFLAGADSEDLIQEGMLGLIKAIRSYDGARGVPFRAYARVCVLRRIFSAVRSAEAGKHQPLNHSESISDPLIDDSPELPSMLSSIDPAALVIGMEEQQESMQQLSGALSPFENDVLELFLRGLSYQSMAKELDRPVKAVDNAIQRIRRKAALILQGEHRN